MAAEKVKKLYRSKTNSVIAGICGGIGEYFDVDPVLIRALFVLVTLAGGSGIFLYLILWIIIPREDNLKEDFERSVKDGVGEMRAKAKIIANELKINKGVSRRRDDSRFLWAFFIILLGLIFLLNNFGFYGYFDFGKIWPVFLILLGLIVLFRRND